tara:strand:+ start:3442 stop:3738 length:297 start_codon:yes stop_codon:yes gene_type:complete
MLVKLTEVCANGAVTTKQQYILREVLVNPKHVIMIREEARMRQLNERHIIAPGLNPDHAFSKITINKGHTGTDIVVVGHPEIIEEQLNQSGTPKLLRG